MEIVVRDVVVNNMKNFISFFTDMTWLYAANFFFFQWFFVRLSKILDDDNKIVGYKFIFWLPLTGWIWSKDNPKNRILPFIEVERKDSINSFTLTYNNQNITIPFSDYESVVGILCSMGIANGVISKKNLNQFIKNHK